MLRIAAKSVAGNLGRLALTLLAVVISVSFVSGTLVLTDSIDSAFDGLFDSVTAGVDVFVNPASDDVGFGGGPPGTDGLTGASLDEALLDDVLAVDGVDTAFGSVQGIAQIIGPDGEPIGGFGPPTLGIAWEGENGPLTIREGAEPTGPGEVVIDGDTVEEQGFEVGQEVEILVPNVGPDRFTLVGVSAFGDEGSLLGATTASFTLERTQELFDREGQLDQIAVVAADGVDTTELTDRVASAVGSDEVEVISVDEQLSASTAEIDEGLAFLDIALLSFAGVALFVGAFLIVNTFAIVVAQRTREFALLRAVGASAGQLRRQVLAEAGLIGLLGGTLGVVGGIAISEGLQAIFNGIGIPFPDGGIVLRPRVYIASYTISLLVTIGAALLPAIRASRIAPVEALRGTGAAAEKRPGPTRTVIGLLLLVGGTAATLAGLFADVAEPAAVVGGGVAGMFVGVALLAPWIAPPVVTSLGRLLGGSVQAVLARRNAARNPTRTSTTASALMIGVALVSFISIVAASINASVAALIEDAVRADLILSAQGGFGTLPQPLADELREVDGVGSVAEERLTVAQLLAEDRSGDTFVTGADAAVLEEHADFGPSDGALEALQQPNTVIVPASTVEDGVYEVGDRIEFDFPVGQGVALEVVGTYGEEEVVNGEFVIDLATYEEVVGPGANLGISIVIEDGADVDTVRGSIEEVAEAYPGTDVQDLSQLVQTVEEQIDGLLNILIGLLVLAIIIAVIGIVNTLVLSVIERTREIGLLRAVGMARDQVRGTVRREAVLVAVFGALLGIVMGVFFGWALVTALASQGIDVLVFPVPRLLVYVLIAAFAGVVAAVLPARRAARLDVLRAVSSE